MTYLQLDKKKAQKLYPTASLEFKEMLIDTFGKEAFLEKITDRVKTWQDAFEIKGVNIDSIPFKNAETSLQKSVNAHYILSIVSEVLNEGKQFGKYKYYVYTYFDDGSWRFRDCWVVCGCVPVGLALVEKFLAEYSINQFKDLWKDYFQND